MARQKHPGELVLAVVRGDADPRELKLAPARVVSIGRTGNVKIHDPLVSIHHAKLYFDMESMSYVVEDLSSANGTMINGETVRGDARLIGVGTELRIGDTVLRLKRPGADLGWLRVALLVVLVIVAVCCGGRWLVGRCVPPVRGERLLSVPETITTPRGRLDVLQYDPEFQWDHGIGWDLDVYEVTHLRERSSDIAWVKDAARKRIVVLSFDADGGWELEGDVPPYGRIVGGGREGFPTYERDGETWSYDEESGLYEVSAQEGLVVWYRKNAPKPKESKEGSPFRPPEPPGPLQVGRFALKGDRRQFALFLTDRNIQVPIHYVVCEGAFDGVRAQVLTYEGTAQELAPACIRSLRIEGMEDDVFPVAVALDPAGHDALVRDVTRFYGGDEQGLFLAEADRARFVAPAAQDPGGYKGAVKLVVNSDLGIPPPFDPFAEGVARGVHETHLLLPGNNPAEPEAAPEARSMRLPFPGTDGKRITIPTRDCEVLTVDLHGQTESKGLVGTGDFAEVRVGGCGDERVALRVPYAAGDHRAVDPRGTDVAVRVEMDGPQVRTAWISWRP